jgi:hypothetical protein
MLRDEPAQNHGDTVGVPAGPVEQVLHPVRTVLPACSAMLQQVLRGNSASIPRSNQVNRCRVSTRGPARDLLEELTFQRRPQANLYAVACGNRIVLSPYNPR